MSERMDWNDASFKKDSGKRLRHKDWPEGQYVYRDEHVVNGETVYGDVVHVPEQIHEGRDREGRPTQTVIPAHLEPLSMPRDVIHAECWEEY
jgi:hypothetical protein